MLETSQDILNIVKAVSIGALALFLCVAIYYMARILQQGFRITKEMRDRLHKIDELIQTFKEKVEHSTSYLLLIGEGMKKLVEVIREHTGDKKAKTSKKKKGK